MNGMPAFERRALASSGRGLYSGRPMTPDPKLLTREILLGFWKVHILHHAAEDPVVGQWVLTELRRHGYDISPGTLYPLLKRMERNGWLRCEVEAGAGPRGRRYYHLTADGAAVLKVLRETVVELHHEVVVEARVSERRKAIRMPTPAMRPADRQPRAANTRRPAPSRSASVRPDGRRPRRKR
jgi:PadR family transcriptional regulator, regulatory protein PadR